MPKISELEEAIIPLQGDEKAVVVDGGETRQVTVANFTRGGLLAAGDLDMGGNDITNAELRVTDPGRKIIPGTDLTTILDEADIAFLNVRTTGPRFGGNVSLNAGLDVDVAAGAGAILDNTVPSDPDYFPVSWVDTTLTMPAGTSWIYVNNAGVVTSTLTEPSPTFRRLNIILGRVVVVGSSIVAIQQDVTPPQQGGHEWRDLAEIVGAAKPEGDLALSANGANLSVDIASGTIFSPGAGGATITPHTVTFPTQLAPSLRLSLRTGVIYNIQNTLDVGFYDLAGVRTAIPGATSRASIHTFFKAANGNIAVLYGQNWYGSLSDAVAAIRTRTFIAPVNLRRTLIIGWVVATSGATDLSDPSQATFVQADSFGRPALVQYQ